MHEPVLKITSPTNTFLLSSILHWYLSSSFLRLPSLFRSQRGSRTISIRIITCLQHSCAKRSTRCTGHGPPTLPPMVHTSFLSSTAYLILITVVTVPLPLRYHSCLSCLIRSLPHVVTVVLKTTAQIEVVVTNSEKAFLASPELHEEQYDVVEAMGMHLM